MFQLNDDLTAIILKVHVKHGGTQHYICLLSVSLLNMAAMV